jgi:hypothetical protein
VATLLTPIKILITLNVTHPSIELIWKPELQLNSGTEESLPLS